MEESRRMAEDRLLQQWKDIEDLEGGEDEEQFKSKKERWFFESFSFLRGLPDYSHCWCGHKEVMTPLLEPFYGYFQETTPNSSLKILWRRLSKEMRTCTRCVVQHHKAKEFYVSEFVEEVVAPLLDIIRALDEERVALHIKELLHKFNTDTLDPKEDSQEVICVMFEVLMFPSLLDDAQVNETIGPFLLHVEETHDLTLAAGQRYPGVYSLLLHRDQGVRRIALKLAHSLPTFKDEHDMESIQPMLGKCMHSLEYDSFSSSVQKGRPRANFTKEALWIGLTTLLNLLEPQAFLKGVMEKYPMFVSIVLNHVSEVTPVFWNALRCLKLLLEVLGYKLWLGTTFSPGVMRNTLLSQCFHSREERMHVHIFDVFDPFLRSLEALQDGEYENQRRRLLYFLLQQVPLSSNFKPMISKKARQVAFSIIGRGYTVDPPLPPVDCVHFWGPPLVATIKDPFLIPSLKQSATDLIQSIIVADAASLAVVSAKRASLHNAAEIYALDSDDNDADETADETADKKAEGEEEEEEEDARLWLSFLSVTRSVEACEQWLCLPLLWADVLNGIIPIHLPSSFTKGIMWALSRLSIIDSEALAIPRDVVVISDGLACSTALSVAFKWVKPQGCEDGASGEGCANAVKAETNHEELIGLFKRHAEKYLSQLPDVGFEQGNWAWQARMAEPCILLLLDANATFREFGKEVLRRMSKESTLEAGLDLLCSSEASAAAITRGLRHALKQLLHWPLNRCSRALQQLFFHVWKLLSLGDKELPERQAARAQQGSQSGRNGGFLSQPEFQKLSLESPQALNRVQKDEKAWRRVCALVACQVWPMLAKTVIEGRQHLEGAGQLMTFTRMLQLLPRVFRNLTAAQKKQIFRAKRRRSKYFGGLEDGIDLPWFQAFVRWSDVPSPIIQRWWKEAVGSVLEDLKGWEVVLPSELEDVILDLRKPGLELDERRRLQLTTRLLSVPELVLSHQFLEREIDTTPLKEDENGEDLKRRGGGDQPDIILLDGPESVKESWPQNDVIDLTDSPEPSPPIHQLHPRDDDPVPTLRKGSDNEIGGASSHREYDIVSDRQIASEKGHFDWPQRPQVHQSRPEHQAPVASQRKTSTATLDNFLAKFSSDRADREAKSKAGVQVQGSRSSSLFKPPPPKSAVPGKPQKAGSKLSSLRNEHREVLEQRSAVEGFVRHQVRDRVEREARAKQPEVRPVDQKYRNAPASDLDAQLREVVQEHNEADPLDAALDAVRKPRLVGLAEPVLKPKRQLITLEMPGAESVRGGFIGRPKPGFIINPRQIPRLDIWYKHILSLDYLSVVGVSDENSSPGDQLEKVPLTFKSPEQYMKIFQPLVLEEFKSQLQRSHGELNFSDGSTSGVLRLMSLERVDEFQVGRFVAEAGSDGAARACADNEMLLLTRQQFQSGQSQSCHLLAKVESRDRESKSRATVLLVKLYVPAAGDARLSKAKRLLVDRSKWYMTRVMNITPQIREWQALSSLSSLPLLPVILSPVPAFQTKGAEGVSPVARLRSLAEPLQSKLRGDYNESQLRAIAAAIGGKETMTNDHQLTLVQGPPGTGKTKTIVAILSALLALRSSKRNMPRIGIENQPPTSRGGLGLGGNMAIRAASRDAAAMSRVWQDAARAKEMMKESETQSAGLQGQKQRVLVCAQSNAAVDELVARICKNGLHGVDGKFFKPSVVRIGTLKSVHPKSLPVFIDTLVDQRLGSEKATDDEGKEDKEQSKLAACRSKLEEVIEFIQVIESLRSQSKDVEGEKVGQKTGPSESVFGDKALKIIALGESAVTGKLNLLYNQRRALTAELATAEREGKKAYEESKNTRKAIRKDIIRQADVVVTTLSGCGGDIYSVCMESVAGGKKKSKPVQECFFDAVVIDEAAQALEPATLIPLQLLVQTNARCVMVGDPKQLPATVLSQMASKMQYECSMFERLQRGGFPVTILSTQYRMHPDIRQFPSAHFYDDLITDGEGLMASRKAIFHKEPSFGPYVFFNVVDGQESSKGSSASQSLSNSAEVAVALQLYLALKKRYPAELWDGRVGVITPYKQQLRLLQEEFGRALGSAAASEIEFNTVDGFQGREVDILILTTVRASSSSSGGNSRPGEIGFVADVRRMNVALTRARFSMWIIGNAATLKSNSSWASLLSNADRRALIYPVQKPYASFFQKSWPLDPSLATRALKNSKIREHGQENGGAALSGRLRENRGGDFTQQERASLPDFKRREEPTDALMRNGVKRAQEDSRRESTSRSSVSLLDSKRRDEPTDPLMRNGDKRAQEDSRRESTSRSSVPSAKASELRVEKTHDLSREHSHDRRESRPTNETQRNPRGEDAVRENSHRRHDDSHRRHDDRPSTEPKRSHVEQRLSRDESRDRHEGGSRTEERRSSSGRVSARESSRQRHESRPSAEPQRSSLGQGLSREGFRDRPEKSPIAETNRNSSGQILPMERSRERTEGRSAHDRERNRTGQHRVRAEEAVPVENNLDDKRRQDESPSRKQKPEERCQLGKRKNGPAGEENSVVRNESPITDPKGLIPSNKIREDWNLGDGGDRRWRSSGERSGHGGQESREGWERKNPASSKDTDERRQLDSVKENREENAMEAVRSVPQAGQTGSAANDRLSVAQSRRTSHEELTAARKRRREEVSALLPSSSLISSGKPSPSAPSEQKLSAPNVLSAPQQRSQFPPTEAIKQKGNQKDMNDEWVKFQAALGDAEPPPPVASAPRASAPGVPSRASRRPVKESQRPGKESQRPVSTQSKPSSDLDDILSGLSTVTWAQAKGGKLDAPPKRKV